MSSVCTRISSVCQSYLFRMSSVCHLYVLVCHPYVTRMYLHVIHMSLICTRMPPVCYSYLLVCHPYVTRMWFFHEPLLDGFSMFIWFSGTSLFVIELSRICVCRLFSIDGEVSLRIEELISHEFIQLFCEWSCCILSITFVEV